jgi:hypothetical protein
VIVGIGKPERSETKELGNGERDIEVVLVF